MHAQVMKKNSAVVRREASDGPIHWPNTRMNAPPIQNTSGPACTNGRPTMLGISQSWPLPVASDHITPKPAASSFFHGSR